MSQFKTKWIVFYENGEADHWDTDQGSPSYHWYCGDEVDAKIAALKAEIERLHETGVYLAWLKAEEENSELQAVVQKLAERVKWQARQDRMIVGTIKEIIEQAKQEVYKDE